MSDDDEEASALRRSMMGEDWEESWNAGTTSFNAAFKEFSLRVGFSEIWNRPGLSLRDRSLVTVAVLTVLGQAETLSWHVHGALNNGVTTDELSEVLLHCAPYCGIPAVAKAYEIAAQAIAAEK